MTQAVHELTIERVSSTRGASGGVSNSYSIGNRGGSPSKVFGRAVIMDAKAKLELGIRGDVFAWKFLVFSPQPNPAVDLRDRIVFDYIDGQSHTVYVTVPSFARSADARFYKFIGEEKSTET